MASKSTTSKRKKPVSHKRVALVLTSLVATLTLSAGFLLALEGLPISATGPKAYVTDVSAATDVVLRAEPWDYIIVYESGTVAASAADLAEGRLPGGPTSTPSAARPGANFHFVVDSARGAEGELVRGSAWLRQEAGAPNAAWPDARTYSNPYTNAVGICLVGDVHKVSGQQFQQLATLVKELRTKLKLPPNQVLFQWELQDPSRATAGQMAFADALRKSL